MYEGDVKAVIATINEVAKMNRENGVKVGVIATEETKEMYNADYVVSIGTRQDEASIARGLYEVLRSFDATDVGVILSETFYEDELGCSVMNRLIKAAGYRLVKVGNDEIQ
jgi:L-threonylcarbamoyladenylate synthase